jgi:hypothetical protein
LSQLRLRMHPLAREQVYSTPDSPYFSLDTAFNFPKESIFPSQSSSPVAFLYLFFYCAFSLTTKKTERPCASFALRIFKIILASNISKFCVYFLDWIKMKYFYLLASFFLLLFICTCVETITFIATVWEVENNGRMVQKSCLYTLMYTEIIYTVHKSKYYDRLILEILKGCKSFFGTFTQKSYSFWHNTNVKKKKCLPYLWKIYLVISDIFCELLLSAFCAIVLIRAQDFFTHEKNTYN